jgi:nucleotide-binding universal stress UspA family protein
MIFLNDMSIQPTWRVVGYYYDKCHIFLLFFLIICIKIRAMKNILVPTDFSENAGNAVEYAAVIAQACKATITLFNVYAPSVSRHSVISPLIAEEIAQTKIETQEKLHLTANTIKDLYPNVQCHVLVGIGEPVEEILSAAKNQKIDMIIMGTKGASSLEKVLFGSHAAAIIERAACPVLVVPVNTPCHIPKKIVFATDYTFSDIESARLLTSLALFFNATITFLHITTREDDIEEEQKLIEKFTAEIRQATNYKNINSKILSDNTVIMGLDTILQNSGADIIALSTRRRNVFEKLYNPSLTKKFALYTTIPLLAFKAHGKEA